MPRKPRLEFPGAIYHIHHRGNHQEYICQDDDDRKLFLKLLESTIQRIPTSGWPRLQGIPGQGEVAV